MYFYGRFFFPPHPRPRFLKIAEPFLHSLPLQLFHDFPELLRHGQANARGVFGDGDAFVGAVKKNHGGSEHAAAADDLRVEEVRHADEAEDHHLLTDVFEARIAIIS